MKALVLENNATMCVRERPVPVPGEGEVLVKIHACGVCGSDIGRILYGSAYHYPLVPGHEFAGTVAKMGPGVGKIHEGDPVTVFPMLPCGHCDDCQAGRYNLCRHYDYFGSRRDGGFSEYVVVPQWNLVPLPENLPLEIAAMCEPVAVALHAIKRGMVQVGDSVGVAGMGPIGLILTRLAKLAGASQVIAWDIDPEKIAFSKKMGNECTLDAAKGPIGAEVERLLGRQLDVIIEGTGSSGGLEACIGALKNHGRLVAMGNPGGDIHLSKTAYSSILRREITLSGTWNSDHLQGIRDDWETVVHMLTQDQDWFGQLISHRFPLEDGIKPLEMMAARKTFFCKVLYVMGLEGEAC